MQVDQQRIGHELETLATFSATPAPSVTRLVFSNEDRQARAWFEGLCREAGLTVRVDAVGNTFARWQGSEPDAPAVATGSHIDAIPHSGRFDGTVGVIGGLEAIRTLHRAGARPRRSIELILFTSEEPTRFGIGCLGSRLMCGALSASDAMGLIDSCEGSACASLDALRLTSGFTGDLSTVYLRRGVYRAFLELHIEQGPLLERSGIPLGVVTAIAAPAALRARIEGQGGHAGAVLMRQRHDAFLAAAEVALLLEEAARATGSVDSVATTGVCKVFPGLINGIPSAAVLEADIRDIDEARRDQMVALFEQACADTARRRGVTIEIETINRDSPATCAPVAIDALAHACQKHGFQYSRMVSRAYHDALFMSRLCSVSMLFIPCRNGVSHRPEEYANAADIARGALVLAEALLSLAS